MSYEHHENLFNKIISQHDTNLIWPETGRHPGILLQGASTIVVALRVSLMMVLLDEGVLHDRRYATAARHDRVHGTLEAVRSHGRLVVGWLLVLGYHAATRCCNDTGCRRAARAATLEATHRHRHARAGREARTAHHAALLRGAALVLLPRAPAALAHLSEITPEKQTYLSN